MNHLQKLSDNVLTSFNELIARNISNAKATQATNNSIDDDEDRDPLEYAGGEFDADEKTDIVQAARMSKGSDRTGGVRTNVHYLN